MKVYTIIDKWESDGGNLWVANFSTKENAIKCLRKYLAHYGLCDGDKVLCGESNNFENGEFNVEGLFDYLLNEGCGYNYWTGSDDGQIFVRGENIQEEFNEDNMPW